jgi:MYXO-CTERM domain-containing protein
VDGDLDGFGGAVTVLSCIGGPGRSLVGGDCDDTRPGVHPGALERCLTAYDDDCDGTINEASAVDAGLYYGDADSDGYGDPARSAQSCVLPLGFVTDGTDCNDALSDVNPGEPERCLTPFDDDCDGVVNEASAVDARLYYGDVDSDGFGDPVNTLQSCAAPTGFVSDNTDCNDALADVNPGEPERCFTPFDDDCDGLVNDGTAVDATPFYADADADGYGALGTTQPACVAPSGFVADATDCDDGRATVHPAAPERCDGLDDNCDGALPSEEVDDDGDGFVECFEDALGWQGAPIDFGDCDDGAPDTHPGAMDVAYDGIDQDCDGSDRCDDDGDGFDATACGGDDCDDTLAAVNPDAEERYYDGVDDNCAPEDDDDMDGDGHDSASYGGDDCDDADPDTYPGAADAPYDGVVNDCEPSDENDVDGDGFDATLTGGSDCDDNNSAVRPGAEELWYDGVDDDCDGNDDDQDRDGYPKLIDCDDTDPDAYPGAPGYGLDCSVDDGVVVDTGGLSGDGGDGGDGGGKFEGGDTGCATAPTPKAGLAGLLGALGLLLGLRRRR